jgi:hypothetical protein
LRRHRKSLGQPGWQVPPPYPTLGLATALWGRGVWVARQ